MKPEDKHSVINTNTRITKRYKGCKDCFLYVLNFLANFNFARRNSEVANILSVVTAFIQFNKSFHKLEINLFPM